MEPRRITLEALSVLALAVAGALVFRLVDAYDLFYRFTRTHESWQLDEYLLALPLLLLGFLFFAYRRLRAARRQMGLLRAAEEKARRAEADAAQLGRIKEEFMAVMSHELRTPLAGVLGMLSVLASEDLTPDQERMIRLAQAGGQSLNTLLNDVLEFSRLEHGKKGDAAASFSPAAVARSVYDAYRPAALAKDLHMAEPDTAGLPESLVGMEGAIRHVLLNLVGNAVKFTVKGAVAIGMRYRPLGNGAGRLVLEVSDTGPGIREEDRERIFEPFTQLDSALNRRQGGIGLGLSLVKRLVGLLGGGITLESEPGRGSTFRVDLPVSESRP